MGITYDHHRPGAPCKFVLDSPLRVGINRLKSESTASRGTAPSPRDTTS